MAFADVRRALARRLGEAAEAGGFSVSQGGLGFIGFVGCRLCRFSLGFGVYKVRRVCRV